MIHICGHGYFWNSTSRLDKFLDLDRIIRVRGRDIDWDLFVSSVRKYEMT